MTVIPWNIITNEEKGYIIYAIFGDDQKDYL
jgi:hypothetical protein